MLFLISAPPVSAAITDGSVDLSAVSYNSIVNDIMQNRCPFSDYQSYVAFYNACREQNSCLPVTEWFKSDTGFVPVDGVIVGSGANSKFYPRTCYQGNFQNSSTEIPAAPTVAGASTEVLEVQAVTGASDISFSITAATAVSVFSLIVLYFVLVNRNWFTKLWLGGYSRYARFMRN